MRNIYFHSPKTVPADQLKRAVHVLLFFAAVLFASMIPSKLFAGGAAVTYGGHETYTANKAPADNPSLAARVFTASSDASLSSITLTPDVSLTKVDSVGNPTTYTAAVTSGIASVTVTPTTHEPTATVTVNGTAVTSGTASGSIALGAVGSSTTINTVVTAGDGVTTHTYSITVTRESGTNANLANLAISSGTLTPAFDPGTISYTASLTVHTASITVTPTAQDPLAAITVNGTAVTSGNGLTIVLGADGTTTTLTIVVKAGNGTTKTYSLAVNQGPTGNAQLSSIALTPNSSLTNAGTVGSTTTYTTSVSSATASVTVTPTTSDANATVKVNGTTVVSGTASGNIALAQGAVTTITTVVTARDGITTRTYLIKIQRGLSGNATLSSITLTPFSNLANLGTVGTTTTYSTSVSNATTSVKVTATTNDADATVKVNGVAVTSGMASGSITLAVGLNTINTIVTAQDGTTTRTYAIQISRESNNATLHSIALTPVSPLVNTGTVGTTTTYTTSVSNATTSVKVTATTNDAEAKLKVNGVSVTSGTASASIALAEGAVTTINTVVTAGDGVTTETYLIKIARGLSNNATLSTIALTPVSALTNTGTVGTTTTYTTSVSNATTSVKVTATTNNANATVKVNGVAVTSGTASGSIALAVGANTINTVVTAQDGTTTETYSIKITRLSNNATLNTIALTPVSPLVNTGTVGTTTTYTTSVSNTNASVKVTPTTNDANATVKVNGVAVTSGTASASIALAEGAVTTINTVVTAQDGITTETYSIKITRAPSSNATLSTIALTPVSALTNTGTVGATTTYTTSVSNATTSVKVTATTNNANAKVKVNGVAVTSGTASASIALAVGSNTINTVVTAQDGTTTETYSIIVTRATGPLMSLYLPISVVRPTDNLNIENDGLMVHQALSPNGDGINDVLTIDGITAYPENHLTIIDRSGSLIFQAKGYDNITKAFDGHSGINGRMQQPGTYFYSLDYIADGLNKHKTGYILLKY